MQYAHPPRRESPQSASPTSSPARSCPCRAPSPAGRSAQADPKSRIWFVMFAGVKKNVASGNFVCSSSRSSRVYFWRVLLHRASAQSGFRHPSSKSLAMPPERQIDAAVRQSDVVQDEARSRSAGIHLPDLLLHRSQNTAPNPRSRSPCGGLTCSFICPESTYGKKSFANKKRHRQAHRPPAHQTVPASALALSRHQSSTRSCSGAASSRTGGRTS